MKKCFVAVLIIVLCFGFFQKVELSSIASSYGRGDYYFFVEGRESLGQFTTITTNGDTTILTCPTYKAETLKKSIKGRVLGESFCLTGDRADAGELIDRLKASVIKESKNGDIHSIYLYYGELDGESVELFGKRVNMQIVLKNGYMQVGYPVLLGSY